MEIWKPINNFNNYHISSYGNVKNIITNRILKPFTSGKQSNMYYAVWLGAKNKYKIHKLVANAFLDFKENCVIDHIDKNKTNNNVNNLRYISNMMNSWNSKTFKNNLSTKEKNINKTQADTYCVRIMRCGNYVFIKNYKTLNEAIIARDKYLENNYLIL